MRLAWGQLDAHLTALGIRGPGLPFAPDDGDGARAALGSKATAAELRQANGLAAGDLAVGTKVAVPIRDDAGVVPVDALATALRKGGGTPPALYVPGSATLDGFQGRVALHALEIANGDSAGEAYGYRLFPRVRPAWRPLTVRAMLPVI